MPAKTHCPVCGTPCKMVGLRDVDVFNCPRGHRVEQTRLFAGAPSGGIQTEMFAPESYTRSTPLQSGLFECKSALMPRRFVGPLSDEETAEVRRAAELGQNETRSL